MSSNNSVFYEIVDKSGKVVTTIRHNLMCQFKKEPFFKFKPLKDYKVIIYTYDEEGEMLEKEPVNLEQFLKRRK